MSNLDIAQNLKNILQKTKGFGVTLIVVSKLQSVEKIEQAIDCGITDFGENYVQELKAKAGLVSSALNWHFIGPLQSNKVNAFLELPVCALHSLSSLSLAKKLDLKLNRKLDVFIQVNFSEEKNKTGLSPHMVPEFLEKLAPLKNLNVVGLMVLPPMTKDEKELRFIFRKAQMSLELWRDLAPNPEAFSLLSMGTSQDYELAIEYGATHIRVGQAVLGERSGFKS